MERGEYPLGYILPKSDFSEAVGYLRNQWQWLGTYVNDGRIAIDNNLVEQLMKQVALGRKAWLFVDNVESGERSVLLMSIVSSARRHDLDVWVYLNDVLEQVLAGRTDYQGLLPDVWKLEHPEAVRQLLAGGRRKAHRRITAHNQPASRRDASAVVRGSGLSFSIGTVATQATRIGRHARRTSPFGLSHSPGQRPSCDVVGNQMVTRTCAGIPPGCKESFGPVTGGAPFGDRRLIALIPPGSGTYGPTTDSHHGGVPARLCVAARCHADRHRQHAQYVPPAGPVFTSHTVPLGGRTGGSL